MKQNKSLSRMRTAYKGKPLLESEVPSDPVELFHEWFAEALKRKHAEPNAMVLATSNVDFKPSARVVLLKEANGGGFIFHSNYESRKGKEILWNPYAALVFFWSKIHKQVRVEGRVKKLSSKESDQYFLSRPLLSRISAVASPQSSLIESREWLEQRWKKTKAAMKNQPLQRPAAWGGYMVVPNTIEFWQGRENRLHDRILYTRIDGNRWRIQRLAP